MIRARTTFRGPDSKCCRIGSAKAAVFPVPVWAIPMRSLPAEWMEWIEIESSRFCIPKGFNAGFDSMI